MIAFLPVVTFPIKPNFKKGTLTIKRNEGCWNFLSIPAPNTLEAIFQTILILKIELWENAKMYEQQI